MKTNWLLTLFLVLAFVSLQAQGSFKQNYDLSIAPSSQSFDEVVLLEDDHLFFAGENTKDTDIQNWVLTKTDSEGNELWTKFYGTARFNELSEMINTTDGGALLIGFNRTFINDPAPISTILKVDADGEEVWFKDIGIGVLLDGDFLSNGNLIFVQLRAGDLWAIEANAQGEVLQEFLVTEGQDLERGGLTVTADGGFFAYGGNILTKYNAELQIEWTDDYLFNEFEVFELTPYFSQFTDGDYLFAGAGNFDNFFIIIDSEGEITHQAMAGFAISENVKMFPYDDYTMVVVDDREIEFVDPDLFFGVSSLSLDDLNFDGILTRANDAIFTANGNIVIGGSFNNADLGQNAYSSAVDIELEEIYTNVFGELLPSDFQRAWGVTATTDGGYAIAGEAYFSGKQIDFTLIKTDSEGNVEWENIVGTEDLELLYSVANTSDGGFLTTGLAVDDQAIAPPQVVITKLDMNGNLIWERRLDHTSTSAFNNTHGVELSDGSFAIAYPLNFARYQVTKLSASGNVVWTNDYAEEVRRVRRLIADDNGGFSFIYLPGDGRGQIVETNSSGEVVLNVPVDASHPETTFPYGLEHTSDGGYMVAGTNNGAIDYFIAKLDANGVLEWVNEYEVETHSTFRPHLVKASDGNYVAMVTLFGADISAEAAESITLHKVDEQGNTIWLQALGDDKWFLETCYDFRVAPNGNLVMGGFSQPMNSSDMLLLVTEPDGTVSFKNIQPLGQIRIAPNPSEGSLNLQFQSEQMGELKVALFNTQGQLIQQFVEQKSTEFFEKQYELSQLPSGHYFLRLELDGRSMTRSWIKQ
jgi:hypothetical protein